MVKRVLKFTVSVVSALSVSVFGAISAFAYDQEMLSAAETLYRVGLAKGNSDVFSAESMDLDSYATRAQVAVTIARMLGKESKAVYQQNSHPFTDVPYWASPYVGWLYENYLINGVSDTYFGSTDTATTQQFCAMLLRVLGYSEADGDFSYSNAVNYAVSIGIADSSAIYKYELLRGDMMTMCLKALRLQIKNSIRPLAKKLCDDKAIGNYALSALGVYEGSALETYFSHIEQNLPEIYARKKGNKITITLSEPLEHYGVRVFYTSSSHPTVTEAKLDSGETYMSKGEINYYNGSAAGYINELTVYNFNDSDGKFVVVKTTSEGEAYSTVGKSNTASIE